MERDTIEHLSTSVKSRAQHLGSVIGAKPNDYDEVGRGWRFVEAPMVPESGLPSSNLGRRMRSELCMQLAGLETRWSAWDRAWNARQIQLERRGAQLGRLSTIEVSTSKIN